jgi:hypothetical protein
VQVHLLRFGVLKKLSGRNVTPPTRLR